MQIIKVDGGVASNEWFCQFMSNILQVSVERPAETETTALGAAILAGLGLGLFSSVEKLPKHRDKSTLFKPSDNDDVESLMAQWHQAVNRVF